MGVELGKGELNDVITQREPELGVWGKIWGVMCCGRYIHIGKIIAFYSTSSWSTLKVIKCTIYLGYFLHFMTPILK